MTWRIVVGVDPSEHSAGWCVLGKSPHCKEWGLIASGQCKGTDVVDNVLKNIPALATVVAFDIESIFKGISSSVKGMKPPAYWKLGMRTGLIAGMLLADDRFKGAEFSTPEPNIWRDAIGIKRGKRNDVAKKVHQWAEATAGERLRGVRGGLHVDRAMAIGIAYASAGHIDKRERIG